MSDLFFPKDVFNNEHNTAIMKFIPMLEYTIRSIPGEPMFAVYETDKETVDSTPELKTYVPASYHNHLKRFLWRYYMVHKVYSVFQTKTKTTALTLNGSRMLPCMLVMLDTVLEQLLLGCAALGDSLDAHTRFPFFDIYLTTEFVVGFHDPAHVDNWRQKAENRDHDLERIDPFQLDWIAYDSALGTILGGSRFNMDVNSLTKDSCKVLIDALSEWYGISLLTTKRKTANNKERLTSGTAGLGLRFEDGGDLDADGETDDDAQLACGHVNVEIRRGYGEGMEKEEERKVEKKNDKDTETTKVVTAVSMAAQEEKGKEIENKGGAEAIQEAVELGSASEQDLVVANDMGTLEEQERLLMEKLHIIRARKAMTHSGTQGSARAMATAGNPEEMEMKVPPAMSVGAPPVLAMDALEDTGAMAVNVLPTTATLDQS